jgi:hypothetical protein
MYGEEKQINTANIMQEIKSLEAEFKQLKAVANLACQKGDFERAMEIIEKLRTVTE